MDLKVERMYNTEDISSFANIILEKCYFYTKKNYVPKVIEDFIIKLGETCAGLFSEDDVWSAIKILQEHGYLSEEIIEDSSIQKYTKMSNSRINEAIKVEIAGFASNKKIKHINLDNSQVNEFITECYTVDSMVNQIQFGDFNCVFSFSTSGFNLDEEVITDKKSEVNFKKNNILVKLKKDTCEGKIKKYVNIIVLKAIEG